MPPAFLASVAAVPGLPASTAQRTTCPTFNDASAKASASAAAAATASDPVPAPAACAAAAKRAQRGSEISGNVTRPTIPPGRATATSRGPTRATSPRTVAPFPSFFHAMGWISDGPRPVLVTQPRPTAWWVGVGWGGKWS